MTNEELKRYNRHIILSEIGLEGQEKLKNASVFVIGAGGLGCSLLLYLTAAGVGRIGIADFDVVDETNLQRQILYTTEDIGLSKAEQAKKRLQLLNPFVKVEAYKIKIDRYNVLDLLKEYAIVVDGSDNFATRYLINDACVICDKPLVFGSIFKFEGQVSVFNYQGGPTYRCLYPEPPKEGEVPNCSEIGVIGVLPGIVGTIQANEVIKIITGIGEILKGKLLMFDALSMLFTTVSFSLLPENKNIKELMDYEMLCGISGNDLNEISAHDLSQKLKRGDTFQLIDVRSEEEFERFNIGGKLISLGELEERRNEISREIESILICQSGKRSEKAVRILQKHGYEKLLNLKGGLNAW
ncbi:MAG TPA: molybdopterin-synthase adenylyltransferase MoeB [Cytophagaceae bacterium]|jgi:molybdopterin/thiamine biosynthesis adenylyltransferase/rhodanese-related sulfurtransferase|nr:molybdopterin-synthase adenylyltransferase MoeB [Cytophagaceae bacterium]